MKKINDGRDNTDKQMASDKVRLRRLVMMMMKRFSGARHHSELFQQNQQFSPFTVHLNYSSSFVIVNKNELLITSANDVSLNRQRLGYPRDQVIPETR